MKKIKIELGMIMFLLAAMGMLPLLILRRHGPQKIFDEAASMLITHCGVMGAKTAVVLTVAVYIVGFLGTLGLLAKLVYKQMVYEDLIIEYIERIEHIENTKQEEESPESPEFSESPAIEIL